MKYKYLIGLMLSAGLLSACQDETNFGPGRQPGYLYFIPTEGHSWADGNAPTRAGVEAPILMENDLDGEPIYLHTEVAPTMSPQLEEALSAPADSASVPETRGIRYTGDVFSTSSTVQGTNGSGLPKISSIGVYATTTSGRNVIFDFAQITPDDTEAYSGTYYGYLWNVKEEEIDGFWDSGTADFYGYAPYFASGNYGLTLTANASTGVPTLTYTIPDDVEDQRDILTAKHLNVAKGSDVELEFTHIMSAIKFKFAYGHEAYTGGSPDGTVQGAAKSSFIWKDGTKNNDGTTDKTYNVKVTKIGIENVYYKNGSWTLGDDPYHGGRWSRTDTDTRSFEYSLPTATGQAGDLSSKSYNTSTETGYELNPDDEEHVFMMMPQQVPDAAKIVLTCTLTDTSGEVADKTMTLKAALKETDGSTAKTWLPGYTYIYTISLSDLVYVFEWDDATNFANWYTTRSYSVVNTGGTSTYSTSDGTPTGTLTSVTGTLPKEEVFIRSYKIDSRGEKSPVKWDIEHQEDDALAVGVPGTETTTNQWKAGAHEWIRLYNKKNGTYDTEVTEEQNGARDVAADKVDANYYQLVINDIMTPTIDLSLWNFDQTKKWTGRSTSNCYIVAGPGTYRIPLIYGNAYTNGSENTIAWNPGNTGTYALSTFLNYKDQPIYSPFISEDVEHYEQAVSQGILVWEEGFGNADLCNSMGGAYNDPSSNSTPLTDDANKKYGFQYNKGTVVKVHKNLVTGDDGVKYLQFEVSADDFRYGNAVVGVLDNNSTPDIVWSWHIWITDPTLFTTDQPVSLDGHSVTFAGTNVGWVEGGTTVNPKNRSGKIRLKQKESGKTITIDATQRQCNGFTSHLTNTLYQWGRKDPMRGNVRTADDGTMKGAPRSTTGYVKWSKMYNNYATVGTLIKRPNHIYGTSQGDLYPSSSIPGDNASYCNLWAANLKESNQAMWGSWKFYGKTIYDPSPVGYCVPPSRFLMTFARRGYRDKFDKFNSGATSPIICDHTKDGTTVHFYTCGLRSTTAGEGLDARGFRTIALGDPALGFYHTDTPYSRDEDFQLHLYFYSGIDTHNKILGDHNEALSIFPVKWNGAAATYEEEDPTLKYQQYLTFTFLGDGNLYWTNSGTVSDQNPKTIEYSLDNGVNWTPVTSSHSGSGQLISAVTNGTKVLIRGNNDSYCNGTYYNYFNSTAAYELSGNIMSLIDPDPATFKTLTALPSGSSYNFYRLFSYGLSSNNQLMAADELLLPATTLRAHCYHSMFENCKQLEIAPNLPATDGADDCYDEMFEDCSALQSVYCMLLSPSTSLTTNWMNRVSSEGQFYYNKDVTTSWTTGGSGIPSNWNKKSVDNE